MGHGNKREPERFHVDGSYAEIRPEPFEIDGATARVRSGGVLAALVGYPKERHEVVNMSKGGMAFESGRAYKRAQSVQVLLYIPHREEPIEIGGKVCWQGCLETSETLTVGVQFDPFGPRRGLNRLEVLDMLRELEETYAPPDQDRHEDEPGAKA